MTLNIKPDPQQILKSAKNILLIDWPNPDVPRALLNAGFTVYGYSPNGYSKAQVVDYPPRGLMKKIAFLLVTKVKKATLFLRSLITARMLLILLMFTARKKSFQGLLQAAYYHRGQKYCGYTRRLHRPGRRILLLKRALYFIEGVNIAEIASKI